MKIENFEKKLREEVSFLGKTGKADSVNFLIWFLKNYFRIDEDVAADIVCDHPNDKGIDGVFVDDSTEEIYLLQSKYRESFRKGEGDGDLRKLVGSKKWFTQENIGKLDDSSASRDLKRIVEEQEVFNNIDNGYKVNTLFVTAGYFNKSAKEYIPLNTNEEYWDCKALYENYTFSGQGEFVKDVFVLESELNIIDYSVAAKSPSHICVIKAKNLLRLKGIVDRTLFAKNVRYGLGRTRVNRDIAKTIKLREDHKKFLLFHNGITLIAENVWCNQKSKTIKIENYSIVNGCQSTLSLYENKDEISDDLKVIYNAREKLDQF